MSEPALLEIPLEIRRKIWHLATSSSVESDSPMQLVGSVDGDRVINHSWHVSPTEKSRNRGILSLFLTCRQISAEAQSVFYSDCTFYTPLDLRYTVDERDTNSDMLSLKLEMKFERLPSKNLRLTQRCAMIVQVLVDSGKSDPAGGQACSSSSLPQILDTLMDQLPILKHLTLALCIQKNDKDEYAPGVAEHLLSSFKGALKLDQFSVFLFNPWSPLDNPPWEYQRETMITIEEILSKKLNLLDKWYPRGRMGVIIKHSDPSGMKRIIVRVSRRYN